MFTVYHSNQLDLLKTLSTSVMKSQPLRDPLKPEIILVQSNGMAQWIQLELATQLGIAANIDFLLPDSFIWKMFTCFLPDIPDKSAYSKAAMTWRLMGLLPRLDQQSEFTVIKKYLRTDDDRRTNDDKRNCFQFSTKIADLFDQYMVFRPDWLESWQRGEWIDGVDESQRWQAPLWRALIAETARTGEPLWHRANLYKRFIQTLEHIKKMPEDMPDRVFICGISALPPTYLQALQALSRHVDIHLLFTNPCRYYWGDVLDRAFLARLLHRSRQHYQLKTAQPLFRLPEKADALFDQKGEQQIGNPLLASWGKQGRDNLYLLAQLEEIVEVDAFVEPAGDSLLSMVQRDILLLEDHTVIGMSREMLAHSRSKRLLQLEDRSLSLHACHSPQREVEVLHDNLLAMMTKDASLRHRDIIVMVADIDRYTPAIQAVFGNTGTERYLPYTLSDRRVRHLHPVLPTFLSLLELPRSRFTAEQVLALLEVPALAARFSIREHELTVLRQWVDESGIRWGLDDDTLRELMLPATGQHTWQFGLNRMLLGYAMDIEIGDWQGILPYDESHGWIAGLVGHLAELLTRLHHWRDRLAEPRSLETWLTFSREIIEDFFIPDVEAQAALELLENQWKKVLQSGLQEGYDQPIPVTLLQEEIAVWLNQEQISQHFLSGAINFCTLTPMRSIPFQVVCLLGMNDSDYPRKLPSTGFDLIVQKPRRGDRSRRNDDRYLFLEALLSAQKQFYISFIGRTIQDNTPRYASVLVSELSDYIEQSFYLPGDADVDPDTSAGRVRAYLCQQHSRMPFSTENFMPGEKQSFASEWLAAARAEGKPQPNFISSLAAPDYRELSLDELLRFYSHPVRVWFKQRLMVSFYHHSLELAADEPFIVASPTRYQLNQRLVNLLIDNKSTDLLYRQVRAAGQLPYGAFGELYWVQQCQKMSILADQVRVYRQPDTRNVEVLLTLGKLTLYGRLAQVQTNGLLRWRPGALSVRDGLLLWLEHLVYCASGGEGESRMFGTRGEWNFAPLPTSQAKDFLLSLVSGYCKGMTSPLLLLNCSGGAWLSHCYDHKTNSINREKNRQKKARAKLIQAWQGDGIYPGEGKDPYLQRLIRKLKEEHIEAIISATEHYFLVPFIFNKGDR